MNRLVEQPRLLTRHDLKRMGVKVSNTSLLRWEALGRFPRRIRMAGTSVAWLATDVNRLGMGTLDRRANGTPFGARR